MAVAGRGGGGARPHSRGAGGRPAFFIGQSGLRARVLMSGGRECGGRSGGGRPAARARLVGRRVGVAASMLLGCGSASHTRGARVLASGGGGGGGGAASGARVCRGAGSQRAARRRGSGPGRAPGARHGTAAGRRRGGAGAAAAAAGRRVRGPAERAGEAAGALPRHLQLHQGVHHLRGLFLGAQGRAGRHQLPVSEWDPSSPRPALPCARRRQGVASGAGTARPDPTPQPAPLRLGGGALRDVGGVSGPWGNGGNPDKSLWQCFSKWPADHLHQTHLGELVPVQILGPAPNKAGALEWSLGV